MRRAILLAAVAALTAPATAAADDVAIRMPGKYFEPARITTVAGDVVSFRNNDLVTHDVRIGGGVFDSGPIGRFTAWSQAVERPGEYPFACTLHAFMSGNLSVAAATLAAAPDGALAGERLTLSGRAPAGTGAVALERAIAGGDWVVLDPSVPAAADGTFSVGTPAVEGASYRIGTPAGPSPVVTPRVTARVDVRIAVRHGALRVRATPPPEGMVATLELYARWRYRWRSGAQARLDDEGRARLALPAGRRTYARVTLRRGARGPALVRSGVVKAWNGHAAQDPDMITPAPSGGHDGGHGGHDGGHGGGH